MKETPVPPPHRPKSRLLWPWALAAAVAVLVAVLFRFAAPPLPEGNLSGSEIRTDFTLLDANGGPVTSASFDGKWRLVYFGYTFCPDVCPVDLATMAAGITAFDEAYPRRADRLQPLFISVDPERDTPDVMAEYTGHFSPRILGLTGSVDQVKEALGNFRVYAKKAPGAEEESYVVDHLAIFYLLGPKGEPIEFLAARDATAEDVAAMLERFLA